MKYNKIVLMFPGQGSQYKGMGKEFFDGSDRIRGIYNQASEILGFDISDICFKETLWNRGLSHFVGNDLDRTRYAQPAIFTTSYVCYMALQQRCSDSGISIAPFVNMGHSIGEYAALVASNSLPFKEALGLVNKRALYMANYVSNRASGLVAIVRIGEELNLGNIGNLANEHGVEVALINTPYQIVVGGPTSNLRKFSKHAKEKGYVVKDVRVEGAFHTKSLGYAANEFRKDLEKAKLKIASPPIIANVTAQAIADPEDIIKELPKQIYSPVRWSDSVKKAIENGADLFIEIGPKETLSKMVQAIIGSMSEQVEEISYKPYDKDKKPIKILHVGDLSSLEKTVQELVIKGQQ